ncbi:hypothetical protein PPERSA_10276 [Pseudocohnilembus persalinus]|uniref:C2HC/C3H-type domain-containing protein n=1 Tax=Pseudocohnilembus persalinus TaxID=266149 RepID=A0A0V0R0P8_PSEPJ|nr:hypothetical protein PPERSA_10276 [Pseudocohnilembus persalinus]|eukprot:KRX07888.1 hypothetical protein PPERSA_10276 [Pseudocohnilembus persalinus]
MMKGGGFGNRPRSLVCYICGREYGTASLKIHLKTCEKKFLDEQSYKPKKLQKPLPRPPASLLPFLGQGEAPKNAYNQMHEYNEQAFDDWNTKMLDQCVNCGRTFKPESLVIHQKSCTSKNPMKGVNKPVNGSSMQQQQKQKLGGIGRQEQQIRQQQQQQFQEPDEYSNVQLVPCAKCGRNFQSDRVQKHQSVCKANKPARKTKHQRELEMKEKQRMMYDKQHKVPKNNWRAKHQEFVEAMKYNRQVNQVEKMGGDIRQIAPPKQSQAMYADYIQCPHCGRKFNQSAGERHIPKCATTIAKPKPVGSYGKSQRLPVSKNVNYSTKSKVSAFRDCIVPGSKQAQNIQRTNYTTSSSSYGQQQSKPNGRQGSYGGMGGGYGQQQQHQQSNQQTNPFANPNKSIKIGNSNVSSLGGRYY